MSEATRRIAAGATTLPNDHRLSSMAAAASSPSPAKKVVIKSADMKDDLQKDAVDISIAAFEKHNVEKDVAEYIKKEFDNKHGPTWHCIVGKNFVKKFTKKVKWDSNGVMRDAGIIKQSGLMVRENDAQLASVL